MLRQLEEAAEKQERAEAGAGSESGSKCGAATLQEKATVKRITAERNEAFERTAVKESNIMRSFGKKPATRIH